MPAMIRYLDQWATAALRLVRKDFLCNLYLIEMLTRTERWSAQDLYAHLDQDNISRLNKSIIDRVAICNAA
ncbi:hypothetical protein TNCV_4192341 [Trichonephila clavipes]|nr:hypothetical protein TNCV_4192341 [Trichonephila clavipes]